jgi:hypothetical protein
MSDLDEAKESLMTITKRRLSSTTDESVIIAVQILLRDYIERKTKDAEDKAVLC